jgi:hypothetical protein
MTELLQTDRHVALGGAAWNEDKARAAIREIADDALQAFDPEKLWPSHPMDGVPDGLAGAYMGATGVILALDHLQRCGAIDGAQDLTPVLPVLAGRDDFGLKNTTLGAYGSLFMSDLGPMLLEMRLAPDAVTADRIFARAEGNNALAPLELMWGTPGSMLACLFMHGRTGEARWEGLYRTQASRLLAALQDAGGFQVWRMELYGQTLLSLGLVHGFAGCMFALLRGWHWLEAAQRQTVEAVALHTLHATAVRDGAGVNWPANADKPGEPMLCQICHGAPGILTAFARAPFSTPAFESLLLGGGALIWAAGPLAKGSNICHGTGGNGYAFLALHKRTGDAIWLERARAFAATAIAQMRAARAEHGRGRYSLWTGDIGLAVYLWDCIRAEPAFPTLDFF